MPRKLTCVAALTVAAAGLLAEAAVASAAPAPSPQLFRVVAGVSGSMTETANADGSYSFATAGGSGTWLGHGKVDFAVTGTLQPGAKCSTFTGIETLTLHGTTDSVTGDVAGIACPVWWSKDVQNVKATNVITSGSGKFSGATGRWSVAGTITTKTDPKSSTTSTTFSHSLLGMVVVPAASS